MTQLDQALSARKLFRRSDLIAAGIPVRQVTGAVRDGRLLHPELTEGSPERGVYVAAEARYDQDLAPALACLLTGGILCRTYAAVRHGLVADFEGPVEILAPYGRTYPEPRPWLVLSRTRNQDLLTEGVDAVENGLGTSMRITSPARTVIDLLSGRGRGEERRFGVEALRTLIDEQGDTVELLRLARLVGGPALETIDNIVEGLAARSAPQ